MAALKLEGVYKSFGSTKVIDGIDLAIEAGQFIVFIGASGSGKSTLLRMIAGLETLSAGRIFIGERDVTDAPPAKRDVSMVFQSYALYPHMTVSQNISFGLKLARKDKHAVAEAVDRVARMLQIEVLLDRKPNQLSGGQRQRVAIARAIVREPKLFLFDEPLSNLDAALRTRTRMEIKELHRSLGTTMIYVTHDQVEAMSLADCMVVLHEGRIEQVGPPSELYRRPATTYVASFLGSPTMNFFRPLRVEGDRTILSEDQSVSLPPGEHSGIAQIGIRPEDISLNDDGLPALVETVEELGEARIAYARLRNGTTLVVRSGKSLEELDGAQVRLDLPPEKLHLFDKAGCRIA